MKTFITSCHVTIKKMSSPHHPSCHFNNPLLPERSFNFSFHCLITHVILLNGPLVLINCLDEQTRPEAFYLASVGLIQLQTKPRWRKRKAGAWQVINASFQKVIYKLLFIVFSCEGRTWWLWVHLSAPSLTRAKSVRVDTFKILGTINLKVLCSLLRYFAFKIRCYTLSKTYETYLSATSYHVFCIFSQNICLLTFCHIHNQLK